MGDWKGGVGDLGKGPEGPAPLFWVKRNLKRNKNRQGKQKKNQALPLSSRSQGLHLPLEVCSNI